MECENKPVTVSLPRELEESINRVIQKEGYTSYDMKCRNLSTDGGNYIGVLYEIDVTGSTLDGVKETNIFVKNKLENEQLKIYSITDCFERENYIYTELANIFIKLQDDEKIADDERFKMAKCFDECNASSIILENLVKRGFKTYSRMDVISVAYAESCIQHLAKFHALSFVIQNREPDYFKRKIEPLNQPFIIGDDWHGFVRNMCKYSINCLDPDVKGNVEESILKKVHDYGKYMNDASGVRTLCHGDYKHNNIMAKEVNGTLTEVLAIDYQLLHYGKPILDLLYFIFNGTDQDFRREHLDHLKNLYYNTMMVFLDHFAMDIKAVFPKEDFEREFKEKLDFGLMINVFYVPFLFACEEDAPDVVNQSLETLAFKVDERFGERFRGVVDDFIQLGYI